MNYNDIFIEAKLPKSLTKEELIECIRQAREGNLEARNKVITCNIKLVLYWVLKKFINIPYEKKDLVSIGILGLVKAVDTFDVDRKIDFSTYAIRCIDSEIIMFIRKEKKYFDDVSLNQLIASDNDCVDLSVEDIIVDDNADFVYDIEKQELLLEVRRQVDKLDGRDKEIVKLFFGFYDDRRYFQKEIAIMMGLSRSYVSSMINHIASTIGRELEKQNLIEKERRISSVYDKRKLKRRNDSAKK